MPRKRLSRAALLVAALLAPIPAQLLAQSDPRPLTPKQHA
jgi:hypothetical protein